MFDSRIDRCSLRVSAPVSEKRLQSSASVSFSLAARGEDAAPKRNVTAPISAARFMPSSVDCDGRQVKLNNGSGRGDMSPDLPGDDVHDGLLRDSEAFGDIAECPTSSSGPYDFDDLAICKLTEAASNATRTTPLRVSILDVLLVSPEKQVIRPYAGRVVAAVEDVQPLRDNAVYNLPHCPVSPQGLPSGLNLAVSAWSRGAGPGPAVGALVHPLPDPLRERPWRRSVPSHESIVTSNCGGVNG